MTVQIAVMSSLSLDSNLTILLQEVHFDDAQLKKVLIRMLPDAEEYWMSVPFVMDRLREETLNN